MTWHRFVGITLLLYGLINPIGVIPIYLTLVRKVSRLHAHRVILIAASAVGTLLIVFAAFGEQILAFFNVGLDDFRIAGGLLALFIAFEMFQAHYGGFMQTLDEKHEAESDLHGIAITPLAFPLLVGPAEMGVIITLSNDLHGTLDKGLLIAACAAATSLIALTLWMAFRIQRLIGKTGINVATRFMALIVASLGVDFILTGIRNQLPGLTH
jgi:multiple antibiotic resistance protein